MISSTVGLGTISTISTSLTISDVPYARAMEYDDYMVHGIEKTYWKTLMITLQNFTGVANKKFLSENSMFSSIIRGFLIAVWLLKRKDTVSHPLEVYMKVPLSHTLPQRSGGNLKARQRATLIHGRQPCVSRHWEKRGEGRREKKKRSPTRYP